MIMNVLGYDFESELEQGFKSLFKASGFTLLIADDYEEGEIPDEALLMNLAVGGVISEESRSSQDIYNHYEGTLEIEIITHRLNASSPVDERFKNRHNELVANVRKLIEEIGEIELSINWKNVTPTRIIPTGTERENNESHRMATLSYSMQFRIA